MKKIINTLFGSKKDVNEQENTTVQILSQYEKIAQWLSAHAPDDWRLATVACKVFDDSNHFKYFFHVTDERKKKIHRYPRSINNELYGLFIELNKLSAVRNEVWIGCRYQVDHNGKYDVKFFYKDMELEEIANI